MKQSALFRRRTKIVSTLGPATNSPMMIERLIRAGMEVARLNLSYGTMEEHAQYIRTIRKLCKQLGRHVAILIDLPGPKYRIGNLKKGQVTLRKGTLIKLTTKEIEGDADLLPVNLPNLPRDVKKGDTILVADGVLGLRVETTTSTEIKCRVTVGGRLKSGAGLVVPGRHLSAPFITKSVLEGLRFVSKQHPDYLALSFVSDAGDVNSVKEILRSEHTEIAIMSKIEREEAVRHFKRILAVSDAIMVARGDLGVEIPLEKVPLVQKEIIYQCNRAGKPVVTATEMLESMVNSVRPTRAEATDVANAILDGTDALMLSAETSIGKYPVQSVTMMAKIARETENEMLYEVLLTEKGDWIEPETDELISYNACHTAYRLGAVAIVAYTQSGSTAKRVSKYRPRVPILALTPSSDICRKLILCWGVYPVKIPTPSTLEQMFATASTLTKDLGLAKPGDLIVITAGIPAGQAGTTNMLKVERID
jgi:pyruvate kinase